MKILYIIGAALGLIALAMFTFKMFKWFFILGLTALVLLIIGDKLFARRITREE